MKNNKNRKKIKKHIAVMVTAAVIIACAAFVFSRPQIFSGTAGKFRTEIQLSPRGGGTATAEEALHLRSAADLFSDIICTLPKGTVVTVLDGSDAKWTKVKTSDGKVGWCSSRYLGDSVSSSSSKQSPGSRAEAVNEGAVAQAKKVSLENAVKPLHIDVSLSGQTVKIFDAKNRAVETFTCSSGKKGSETPTGTFTVSQRGKSFFNDSVGEGAYYWVRFYKAYLFHSVPFDKSGKLEPKEAAKLGEPASHGCLRMSVENAKWIYDNIPKGTTVTIM